MGGEKEPIPQQKTEECEICGNSEGKLEQSPWNKNEMKDTENTQQKIEGLRKSRGYWAKMWKDFQKDGPHGPGHDHTKFMEKWETLKKEGKTHEEIFETLKKENPNPFMWIPFMKQMSEPDDGKSLEFKDEVFNEIKKYHFEKMTPEQRASYEQMKSENKEKEFWKNHWAEMHKDGHCRTRWMRFMHRRGPWVQGGEGRSESNEAGQDGQTSHKGRYMHHWGWRMCGRKEKSDDKSFYKEFDFVNGS